MKGVFPKGVAWVNGEFVDISEAHIPILDWGFLRSDATYDVVHVWMGRFFLLDKHIDRFFMSLKKLRMPSEISRPKLKKILAGCVKQSMIQTRGMSPTFDRDPRKSNPRFMAFAVPFGWILKPEDIEMGLDAAVTKIKRISPNSIDPTIKNYHWLDFVNGMFEAYDRGHQTGILVDEKNNILEGPGFNIFSLNKNVLITPKRVFLQGITRGAVIDIAKELHIPVKLESISKEKLMSSSEFFATSTAGGIMPITKIDGKKIGLGNFGETTRKLYKIYWERHFNPDWSLSVDEILK